MVDAAKAIRPEVESVIGFHLPDDWQVESLTYVWKHGEDRLEGRRLVLTREESEAS